jgi:hypothetical protein
MKTALETIAATLPNGFHDAFLRRLVLDFAEQRATLTLNVWVGDLHAKTDAEREAYRPVTVNILGCCGASSKRLTPVLAAMARVYGLTRVRSVA